MTTTLTVERELIHAQILEAGRATANRFLRAAAVLLLAGTVFGLLLALYYTPLAPRLNQIGLRLYLLRPLHTGATIGWIYFAGMAVVYRWLPEYLTEQPDRDGVLQLAQRIAARSRWQWWLWTGSALIAGAAYATGHTTGREYLEYPPWLALPILAGWLLFVANFVAATRLQLADLPVCAWMWCASAFLFVFSFIEGHAWLLDWLLARPVRDLAIQWMAMGSLVGSFNLLVYGSLSWLGSRLSGDERYARSNSAYALFLIGILNSFTNYGHHTYHLPQSEVMKWISFTVSMTEIAILAKVAWDCTGLGRRWASRGRYPVVVALLIATTAWTCVQLLLAVVISVPPLNVLAHGTLAIPAHSMGTLIGIDTMALLGTGHWLAHEPIGEDPDRSKTWLTAVLVANAGLLLLCAALLWVGAASGVRVATLGTLPWFGAFPHWLGPSLVLAGILLLTGLVPLITPMLHRYRA